VTTEVCEDSPVSFSSFWIGCMMKRGAIFMKDTTWMIFGLMGCVCLHISWGSWWNRGGETHRFPTRGALQIQGGAISRVNTQKHLKCWGSPLKKKREEKSYLLVALLLNRDCNSFNVALQRPCRVCPSWLFLCNPLYLRSLKKQ